MRLLKIFYLLLILVGLFIVGCSSLLEPENDNHNTFDRILNDPAFAEGLLMNAYNKLPSSSFSFNDVATDDAVSNDKFNGYLRMATGQWSAQYTPISVWENASRAILYLNTFIPQIDSIEWTWSNKDINKMFIARLKGEAYALRGLFRYYLLQNHSGKLTSGELMGIQLFDEFLKADADFDLERAGFTESINAIYADFDKASQYLPMDFIDITDASQLPLEFSTVDITDYNTVFGIVSAQRISKRILLGLNARVALLAASPAFSSGDQALWVKAANAAADVISGIGGIAGLDPDGHIFYQAARIDALNLVRNKDQKEMLWRGASNSLTNTIERDNLPPGLYGNGMVNPSQNLVDAFPMKNGYPISDPLSLYNLANPYADRDPRLALYVIYDGASLQSKKIKTGVGGGVNAKDSLSTSTRTGYYLRKLLREDIIFSSDGSALTKKHYPVHIRYTEVFLIYAEAANEVWGPDGNGGSGYSAKDVIAAIRKRAGITQPDEYLNSISSKDVMRELIRNERRLELSFEGSRFWDIRRWGLDLTESAKGVNINSGSYQYVDVEPRAYQPYMQYGPIPEQEVLKFPALKQNAGW